MVSYKKEITEYERGYRAGYQAGHQAHRQRTKFYRQKDQERFLQIAWETLPEEWFKKLEKEIKK